MPVASRYPKRRTPAPSPADILVHFHRWGFCLVPSVPSGECDDEGARAVMKKVQSDPQNAVGFADNNLPPGAPDSSIHTGRFAKWTATVPTRFPSVKEAARRLRAAVYGLPDGKRLFGDMCALSLLATEVDADEQPVHIDGVLKEGCPVEPSCFAVVPLMRQGSALWVWPGGQKAVFGHSVGVDVIQPLKVVVGYNQVLLMRRYLPHAGCTYSTPNLRLCANFGLPTGDVGDEVTVLLGDHLTPFQALSP